MYQHSKKLLKYKEYSCFNHSDFPAHSRLVIFPMSGDNTFKTLKKTMFKSSLSQMFFKIGVLKNFAIFTGKHLCWNLFLIKL